MCLSMILSPTVPLGCVIGIPFTSTIGPVRQILLCGVRRQGARLSTEMCYVFPDMWTAVPWQHHLFQLKEWEGGRGESMPKQALWRL